MNRIATWINRKFLPVLLAVASLSACAEQTSPAAGPVPKTYFGLHIHRTVVPAPWVPNGDKLSPWPTVKFGTWRLWDAYVVWPNLEPEKGQWKFATLDKYVAMANLAGVDVLLPLGLTPPWASARPTESSGYRPGNAAEPWNMEDWRNYVRTVATRYKGRIHAYELWNEVNLKSYYSGTPENMVEMTRIAYQTLKQVDPDITVVSPSMTDGDTKWLDSFLSKGGGQYADVIGYHFYVPKSQPEAMLPVIRHVQQIMQKHNLAKKPLWNTETGWWIQNSPMTQRIGAAGRDWLQLDERQSAAYVARALILGWSSGVSRFYWYAWDNVDMGLIESADKSIKPAGLAYARTAAWLVGSVVSGCTETGGRWVCELKDAQGHLFRIVWRQEGSDQEWSVPAAWGAQAAEMLDGQVLKLSPKAAKIQLGQLPVLIR